MSYPSYTLNFADGSLFATEKAAKAAIKAAVKAASTAAVGSTASSRTKPNGNMSVGVKGSHTAFMDIGGRSFKFEITHGDEDRDKEPILDIIITPK